MSSNEALRLKAASLNNLYIGCFHMCAGMWRGKGGGSGEGGIKGPKE